jgi:hypothetical protein
VTEMPRMAATPPSGGNPTSSRQTTVRVTVIRDRFHKYY